MKKVLVSLTLIGLLAVPLVTSAGIWENIFGGGTSPEVVPETDVMIILGSLMSWMFAILLVVAAIFIIIAAYMFVTASGDPDKTKTARNFVLYALIGVLVAFAARGLVELVRLIVQPAT
ncbi:hypothetical protein KJ841_02170 [Patescibacteria group bacterium]|nr:hypothetical protein [Patescibacteria group bacterium]